MTLRLHSQRRLCRAACVAAALFAGSAHGSTLDRQYRLGDNGDSPPASNGSVVGTSYDNAGALGSNQLHDLVGVGGPVYRTIAGRPDGVTGLGIEFSGSGQYLRAARLGLPSTSASAVGGAFGGTLNYNGISNRGLQFWVQPQATRAQTLVMDTNQHGARISASGAYSMRYAGVDYDSAVAATPNVWRHVMVVRPDGAANGARMFVNGVAVAAAPGGYDGADTSDLVVGANTDGDDGLSGGLGFLGGTEEFFDGIIDDLDLFVIGRSTASAGPPPLPAVDFGPFSFAVDNAFAAFTLSGVAGDVTNDGVLDAADKTAFIAGWMSEKRVNGIRVGDLETLGKGDLNFDGVTDVFDLARMQQALAAAGVATIASGDLLGVAVPEPTCGWLAAAALASAAGRRRRRIA
jgi:hypothetical protein